MSLPVYTSRNVKIAFFEKNIDGFAPDSFVTFSRNSDITEIEVGADGKPSKSFLPDRTGSCTISLQQQSAGNLYLSGLINLQEETGKLIEGSISITDDDSGSVIAVLSGCHIMTSPEIGLGSSASGVTRDWVFHCDGMRFLLAAEAVASEATLVAEVTAAVDNVRAVLGI